MSRLVWCCVCIWFAACQQTTPLPASTAPQPTGAQGHEAQSWEGTAASVDQDPQELPLPASRLQWEPLEQAQLPAQPERRGRVERALRWQDAAGPHVAAFARDFDTARGVTHLQIFLWNVPDGGAPRLQHQADEEVRACDGATQSEFIKNAFWLTDLDQDGIAELTLAYRQGCDSDSQPTEVKVVMVEGSAQFSLVGATQLADGESISGAQTLGTGQPKSVAALDKVPVFRQHAECVWEDIVAVDREHPSRRSPATASAAAHGRSQPASLTPAK